MICLDTNVVIAMLNDRASPMWRRSEDARAAAETLAVSAIVLFELWYGARKSAQRERNEERIMRFLAGPIIILDFGADDAEEAGDIRAALEHTGTPIGSFDILIAAQARRRDALLITANTREFKRVPRLRLEDWTKKS